MAKNVKFDRQKTYAEAIGSSRDADTIYFTTDTHEVIIGGVIYGTAVPKVKNELIYSDDNKNLTTHQLLYPDAYVVNTQEDYDSCTVISGIEKDILGAWHQFSLYGDTSGDYSHCPEYGVGKYIPGSIDYPNTGYGMWYTDTNGLVLNKVNSGDFNGYMIPNAKESYILESLLGSNIGNTSGDQIGFSIINDSNAVARRFDTEAGTYYRNTMYDIYPSSTTSSTYPKRPTESAWVKENVTEGTARVIYTTSPTTSGGVETIPSGTVNVYSISNIKTSAGRKTRTLVGTETIVSSSRKEAAGYLGVITVVVTNSSGMELTQGPQGQTGTIWVFGSIYDIESHSWKNVTVVDGSYTTKDSGNYWGKGYWLVPYNSNLDTNSNHSCVIKNYVSFNNGVLTMRFSNPTAWTSTVSPAYNGSEMVMNFKTRTYDFRPYNSTGTTPVKDPKVNIALPTFSGTGIKDKDGNTVSPDLWGMFTSETKFAYNAYSYNNLWIKCLNVAMDNLIFYSDKSSSMYGVYGLNAERTAYEKKYISAGVPDDPLNYFTGSRISYNDITKKLFYSDGTIIREISSSNGITELPAATTTTLGCVKLGDEAIQTTAANAVSTATGRTYAVQTNSLGQMVVNVPWSPGTNSTYKLTLNGTEKGTTGGADLGSFYAPTAVGTNGQYLKSNGSGAPTWANFPTIPAAANDAKLKIQTGSNTAWDLFSANASSDTTLKFASDTTANNINIAEASTNKTLTFKANGYVWHQESASGVNDAYISFDGDGCRGINLLKNPILFGSVTRSGGLIWADHRIGITESPDYDYNLYTGGPITLSDEDSGVPRTIVSSLSAGKKYELNIGSISVSGPNTHVIKEVVGQTEYIIAEFTGSRSTRWTCNFESHGGDLVFDCYVGDGVTITYFNISVYEYTQTLQVYSENKVNLYGELGLSLSANDADLEIMLGGGTVQLSSTSMNLDQGNIVLESGSVSAAGGFFQTSDIRKKNVLGELDLNKAYDLIDKCQTILYSLKDNPDRVDIGLIAQEVYQFFPEIVSEDKDGMLSLDYAKLTVVILRVLKDLIARVSKLESK